MGWWLRTAGQLCPVQGEVTLRTERNEFQNAHCVCVTDVKLSVLSGKAFGVNGQGCTEQKYMWSKRRVVEC